MANLRSHRMDRQKQMYAKQKAMHFARNNEHWVKKQELNGYIEDRKFEKRIQKQLKGASKCF